MRSILVPTSESVVEINRYICKKGQSPHHCIDVGKTYISNKKEHLAPWPSVLMHNTTDRLQIMISSKYVKFSEEMSYLDTYFFMICFSLKLSE